MRERDRTVVETDSWTIHEPVGFGSERENQLDGISSKI